MYLISLVTPTNYSFFGKWWNLLMHQKHFLWSYKQAGKLIHLFKLCSKVKERGLILEPMDTLYSTLHCISLGLLWMNIHIFELFLLNIITSRIFYARTVNIGRHILLGYRNIPLRLYWSSTLRSSSISGRMQSHLQTN